MTVAIVIVMLLIPLSGIGRQRKPSRTVRASVGLVGARLGGIGQVGEGAPYPASGGVVEVYAAIAVAGVATMRMLRVVVGGVVGAGAMAVRVGLMVAVMRLGVLVVMTVAVVLAVLLGIMRGMVSTTTVVMRRREGKMLMLMLMPLRWYWQ